MNYQSSNFGLIILERSVILEHGLVILERSFNRRGCLFQKETERKTEKKLKKTKQNKKKLGYIQSI